MAMAKQVQIPYDLVNGTLAVLTIVTIFGAPSALAIFLENGCPKNFGIHLLLPHKTDCNKFYQCRNGDLHLHSCVKGTYFNEAIQACDRPWNVECRQVVTTPSTTTVGPFLPNGCPKDFSVHILLSHETDCSLFYECSNGNKNLMSCGDGALFNEAEQVCYWPWNVECRQEVTSSPPATKRPYHPNGCPRDFNVHILLSHETDCSLFYECRNGNKYLMSCGDGALFNEAEQVCDSPWNVDCRQEVTSSPPATKRPYHPNGCPRDFNVHILLSHETDCSLFYECRNGNKYLMSCGNGALFNEAEQVCDWPWNVECRQVVTTPSTTTVGPFLPNGCPKDFSVHILLSHETDCSLFYECSNGNKYLISCADGALFNEAEQGCDWPWNVDCNQQLTTQTSIIPTTTTPSDISTTEVGQNTETEISQTETAKEVTLTTDTYKTTTTHLPTETTSGGVSTDLDSTATESLTWETTSIPDATTAENNDLTETTETTNGGVTTDLVSTTQETLVWVTTSVPDATTAENNDLTETTNGELATDLVSTTQETSAWETTPSIIEITTEDDNGIPTETPICPTGVFGNIPHPTLCNAYYFCSSGWGMLLYCAENFEFSPEARVCYWPWNVECRQEVTSSPPATKRPYHPNGCPRDFNVHILLSHETDCSLFYECRNGNKYLMSCGDGALFNEAEQVCDSPWNVDCRQEVTSSPPATKRPYLPNGCPRDFNVHILLSHETDCSLFYQCSNGNKNLMSCGDGALFNEAEQVCYWPWNVECRQEVTSSPPATKRPYHPNGCPRDFNVHILLSHETDCSLFYECSNGNKNLMSCGDGALFNEAEQVCYWPWNVECRQEVTSSPPATKRPYHPNGCPRDFNVHILLSHETGCSLFYECRNGNKYLMSCGDGALFNEAEQVCYSPWNVECRQEVTSSPPATKRPYHPNGCPRDFNVHILLSHETDCSLFYECRNGNKYLMSCGDGALFNEAEQVCDWPWNVECGQEVTSSSPATKRPYLPNGCPRDFSVHILLSHETDCSLFYQCRNGNKYLMNCGDGGLFNEAEQVVDVDASTESEVTEPTSSPEDDDTTVAVTTEAPICASGVFGNIPHPTVCSAYYFCSGGREMLLTCADTFEFDPETRRCVTITENGCTHKTQEASNGDDDDENTKARIESPIHLDNKDDVHGEAAEEPLCPHGLSAYLPDPTSCNSYFLCYQKRAIKLFCANGFEFNTNIGRCVRMSATGCSVDRNHI